VKAKKRGYIISKNQKSGDPLAMTLPLGSCSLQQSTQILKDTLPEKQKNQTLMGQFLYGRATLFPNLTTYSPYAVKNWRLIC